MDESVEAGLLAPSSDDVAIDPLATCTSVPATERVVSIRGDLDLDSRSAVYEACAIGAGGAVIVDMADLMFMDCSGYGGLVKARASLERRGGSLTLRNQSGQPAYLLGLLAGIDPSVAATLDHVHRPATTPAQGADSAHEAVAGDS